MEPHAALRVAKNRQDGFTALTPYNPLCKILFPGSLSDSRELRSWSSYGLRYFSGHSVTKPVPPLLLSEAPEPEASPEAATSPFSPDT